jgi:hypothetical protein
VSLLILAWGCEVHRPDGLGDHCDEEQPCPEGLVCPDTGGCSVPCDEDSDCKGLVSPLRWTACEPTFNDPTMKICTWGTE